MKHPSLTRSGLWPILFLLFVAVLPAVAGAQDSLVAYSDTTDVLLGASPADTLWAAEADSWPDAEAWNEITNNDILKSFARMMGLTGFMMILAVLFFLLFPFLALGAIIYLLYRLNRTRQRQTEQQTATPAPAAPEDRNEALVRLKEQALRRACWGIGLLSAQALFDISSLLGIAGIALLCMAAYDWMRTRIRK